ncbi:hypothetical protein PSE_2837 [Pseudovibrio sp. FO-BEG1]|nr:hypothetical protein PSE_2837 [Pseudovibrio sp. FO-BEG1]
MLVYALNQRAYFPSNDDNMPLACAFCAPGKIAKIR